MEYFHFFTFLKIGAKSFFEVIEKTFILILKYQVQSINLSFTFVLTQK